MKSIICLLGIGLLSPYCLAEFETQIGSEDPVVIGDSWFESPAEDGPFFSDFEAQRDIAQASSELLSNGEPLQGQLSVLTEIPYSYPLLSRVGLAKKVLAEIEGDGSSH